MFESTQVTLNSLAEEVGTYFRLAEEARTSGDFLAFHLHAVAFHQLASEHDARTGGDIRAQYTPGA